MPVPVDRPIKDASEDSLGRAKQAHSFVRQVMSLDTGDGLVIGVMGAWGSGKTSFINLARRKFESSGCPVLAFNPWMLSGAEKLVEGFFHELSAQLKDLPDLRRIGGLLEEVGRDYTGHFSLPIKILAALIKWKARGKRPIDKRREAIRSKLKELEEPIIVLIDDLDRLTKPEIREMFKLLRLTANFPNIAYIAAFDRRVAERALNGEGVSGRDYLEKIVQVPVELPSVPEQVSLRHLTTVLDDALADIEDCGPFDEQAWPDIRMEIVRPLVKTPRDASRYAAAVHGSISALGGQVALTDVLALEAIKVFLPDVFSLIRESIGALTGGEDAHSLDDGNRRFVGQIKNLLKVAGKRHRAVVLALIHRLFPLARRHVESDGYAAEWRDDWIQNRRVAHVNVLRLYLEHTLGQGMLSQIEAERAFQHMADLAAFEDVLNSLASDLRIEVVSALEGFEADFVPEHVVPAVTALLNFTPEIPWKRPSSLEVDPAWVVGSITYRLLRCLKDPIAVDSKVRSILPRLNSLTSKMRLIGQVGHGRNSGLKLVSEDASQRLQEEWLEEARSASSDDLIREPDLLGVLLHAKFRWGQDAEAIQIPDHPELTYSLLKSAWGASSTLSIGSRFVKTESILPWDLLVKIYGEPSTLAERVSKLIQEPPVNADKELLELATKYLQGWRSED